MVFPAAFLSQGIAKNGTPSFNGSDSVGMSVQGGDTQAHTPSAVPKQPSTDIPEDPRLAETHYSQVPVCMAMKYVHTCFISQHLTF